MLDLTAKRNVQIGCAPDKRSIPALLLHDNFPGAQRRCEMPARRFPVGHKCSIEGCEDDSRKRGWCEFHYDRWSRHGDPLAGGPRQAVKNPDPLGRCRIEGCENKAVGWHLCSKHYAKLKKYGDPVGGYEVDGHSKQWQLNKDGYVYKFAPDSPHVGKNKILYQHRLVMAEHLGRLLRGNELVHHMNGNKSDNRIKNLELFVKGHPEGQRPEDLVKWAREIIALYGEEAKTKLRLVAAQE